MQKIVIEEAIAHAKKQDWTYLQLGKWLTGAPCNLTPPEATVVMNTYRRQYPNAGKATLPASPPARSRKAKATPTAIVAAEGGELSTARPSIINRSAVKSFALKVSAEKRAGKFNRVSKEFLDSVEANLEALIREIAQGFCKSADTVTPDPENDWLINGRTLRCAEEKLNQAVQKIVLAKVHGNPTVGKTLK